MSRANLFAREEAVAFLRAKDYLRRGRDEAAFGRRGLSDCKIEPDFVGNCSRCCCARALGRDRDGAESGLAWGGIRLAGQGVRNRSALVVDAWRDGIPGYGQRAHARGRCVEGAACSNLKLRVACGLRRDGLELTAAATTAPKRD